MQKFSQYLRAVNIKQEPPLIIGGLTAKTRSSSVLVEGDMKSGQYVTTLVLSLICFLFCGAIVAVAYINERQQNELRNRQDRLNNSMISQSAQQIGSRVLNDLAAVAQKNPALRRVLSKHGYEAPPALPTVEDTITEDVSPAEVEP
jgi:hypothetical protein